MRYEDQCAQTIVDRLTALEERMSASKYVEQQAARVQAQSVAAFAEMSASLTAQQAALGELTRSLAPLANLKNEVLEPMQHMFAQQKLKTFCDKRPGPPQPAIQMRSNDVGYTATPPTNNERIEVQERNSSSGVINMGYNATVDRAKSVNPAWMETTRLNPN